MTESLASFVLAKVADSTRLLELSDVREIVPAMSLSLASSMGGRCRGIANVRGEIVPVFDLEERGGELDPSQLIIIAGQPQSHFVGLLVDDVLEIVHLPQTAIIHHSAGAGRSARTVNLRGTPVAVLTAAEVLSAAS